MGEKHTGHISSDGRKWSCGRTKCHECADIYFSDERPSDARRGGRKSPFNSSKLREWSVQVRERDGECVDCGSTENLHAHHIKPKSEHPELAYDVENG